MEMATLVRAHSPARPPPSPPRQRPSRARMAASRDASAMAGQFASGGASGTNGAPSTTGPSLDGAAAAHGPLQAVEFGESSAFAADPPMDRDAWSALAAMDDGRLTEEIHGVEAPVDAALAREWGRLIRNVATRMVLVKMRKDEVRLRPRRHERAAEAALTSTLLPARFPRKWPSTLAKKRGSTSCCCSGSRKWRRRSRRRRSSAPRSCASWRSAACASARSAFRTWRSALPQGG